MPRPKTRAGDLVPLAEVDAPPVPIRHPAPRYHPFARRLGQHGKVTLNVLIDESGKVAKVEVVRGISGSLLNDGAASTVREWTYQPARKDGVPVRVWQEVVIQFEP